MNESDIRLKDVGWIFLSDKLVTGKNAHPTPREDLTNHYT